MRYAFITSFITTSFITLCVACLSVMTVQAQNSDSNSGILYGGDHAFGFQSPKGWVLDNQSGVPQGLDAVFYPKGQTWQDSPVMAYARAHARDAKTRTVMDAVRADLDDLHRHGSVNSQAKMVDPIIIDKTRTARVYYFTGDKWGNYEAVAYISESKTINFFVLNSKTRKEFENSLPAFRSLVKSYIYLGNNPLAGRKQRKL